MEEDNNYIEFNFDIQEVIGKHVADKYLSEIATKCKELKLKHSIEIINREYNESSLMKGGSAGESTFPFNLFERAANKVSNMRKASDEKSVSIFDRLFSFASPASKEAPIEQPKDNTQEPVALEIKEIEADLSFRKDLKNATEIISVKIKVFDDSLISVSCGGSAYELEKCLGNKK